MKKSSVEGYLQATKDQWMTPELLSKIQSNPKFIQSFADPEVMQAVALMQANPAQAKEKYKNNKKVTEFFVEFSKLMGQHFDGLSQTEQPSKINKTAPTQPKPEQKKPLVQEVTNNSEQKKQQSPTFSSPDPDFAKKLEDPTIKTILSDPKMVSLIQALQSGAKIDLYQVARSDPVLASKLKYLMDRGIFSGVYQK
jgi:hypothetical protein